MLPSEIHISTIDHGTPFRRNAESVSHGREVLEHFVALRMMDERLHAVDAEQVIQQSGVVEVLIRRLRAFDAYGASRKTM